MIEQTLQWEGQGDPPSALLALPNSAAEHIVLLIHGFMSHKDSETNKALTGRLLEQGIATLRFDLFGHGASKALFQQLTLSRCLEQVDRMMAWINDRGYKKISAVGSSFGGLIVLHATSRHPDLASLALRCPVSNYPAIWQSRLTQEGIKRWEQEGRLTFVTEEGKATLEYGYYEDLLRHDTYSIAARICTPTLIVHGDADEDVPMDQSLRLFDTLRLSDTQRRLVVIPGADHGFSKEGDFNEMIDQIVQWITSSPK